MPIYHLAALGNIPNLILPQAASGTDPCWHQFVIRHELREELQSYLHNSGVGTLIHYPIPPHRSEAYAEMGWKEGSFPLAESLASTVLSIPMGPHLKPDDQENVIRILHEWALTSASAKI